MRLLSDAFENRGVRFLIMGGLNTIFGYVVFASLSFLGVSNWASLLIGNLFGLVFNFLTHGHVVFRALSLNRIPRFIGVYAALYVVNLLLIGLIQGLIGWSAINAQALLLIPISVLSYMLMANFVFKKRDDSSLVG